MASTASRIFKALRNVFSRKVDVPTAPAPVVVAKETSKVDNIQFSNKLKNSSVIPNNQSKSETKLTNDSNDYKNHTKDSNQEISSHIETAIITEKVLLADSNDAPPAAASIIEQNAAKITKCNILAKNEPQEQNFLELDNNVKISENLVKFPEKNDQPPQVINNRGGEDFQRPSILKTVKAHVPMIKFRKGSMLPKPEPIIVEATPTIASVAAPSSQPHQWIPNQSINLEWWQTPQKFKRRNVDDLEIDIINSGGADQVYR